MRIDNAAELVNNLTIVLGDSIEQVQTTENLDIVANVLEGVVDLLDEGNFTVDASVRKAPQQSPFSLVYYNFFLETLVLHP